MHLAQTTRRPEEKTVIYRPGEAFKVHPVHSLAWGPGLSHREDE